jgi:hypothetical protein
MNAAEPFIAGFMPGVAPRPPPVFSLDTAHDSGQKGYDRHTLGLLSRPVEQALKGFLEQVTPIHFGRQPAGMDAGNHLESQEIRLRHQLYRQCPGSRCSLNDEVELS